MTDLVVNEVVVPAAKWTLTRIWQELGYMFCYKSNIGELKDQVVQLRHKRDGIKQEEKSARDASKNIDGQVADWLVEADKQIEETETTFNEKTVAAKAACCNGWLPSCKGRFSLGRRAKKMTQEVEKLFATEPKIISHPAPHPEVEFQPTVQLGTNFQEGASSSGTSNHEQPTGLIPFDSRRSTFGDVMEALRGNEINPVIICGLGGMGKTTLMGQVHEKAKEEGLFDEYTKATFKDSLDVMQIQSELAEYLGLPLEEKETGPRASKLRQRLSQGSSKKILVMLDNVWTTTPNFLWDIGIPPSCKLLVTSRQQDLFKDMGTKKNFPIYGLPDEDAWSLFKKTAGSSIASDPELHVVAEEILKKCAGLPIAISTVGTALKGESIGIWKNALKELEKARPENVDGVIEHVYGPINFSYQSLPSQAIKLFFLLCCIFKGSADIQIEDLVRYGIGLGLFIDSGSMVEVRNCVETLIQKLKSRFLLLDSDQKGCVRMHDLVRDVGVHIASEELGEKKNVGVEKTSIVVRDKARTVEFMDWPKNIISTEESTTYCTSLSINGHCQLFWLTTESPLHPPPTSNTRMKELKVLAIMGNYYHNSLDSVLPSLAVLRNLQTLRLERCAINSYVSVIGELNSLVILSLRGSNIEQLPDTFKNLSDLRLLDLSECSSLMRISPGVLSSLSRLEELYMVPGQSYRQRSYGWNSEILAELLSLLPRLTTLQVALPAVNMVLASSSTLFNKLESFKIAILNDLYFPGLFCWPDANYLEVQLVDASATVGSGITSMIKKTENLNFEMTNLSEPQVLKVLDAVCSAAKMRSLRLYRCDAAEYLCDTTSTTTTPHDSSSSIFPVLNSLVISHASRMKEIFHGELLTGSLRELRSLNISSLPAVTYIWKAKSPSEWGVLRNIIGLVKELYIGYCESLEEIVAFEYVNEEVVIKFQSLEHLTLRVLPNFTGMTKNISKQLGTELVDSRLEKSKGTERPPRRDIIQPHITTFKVHFPVLKEVQIENVDLKVIWNDQLSEESFCELKSLEVMACDKLLHVVPTHMQNRLHKLESVKVRYCSSLKEIFEIRKLINVGDEGEAAAGLTNSESGNQGSTQINKMVSSKQSHQAFQNLKAISIYRCESLSGTLLPHLIAKGLVKLEKLQIEDCEKIEEIVAAVAEGDEETEDENMLPQLRILALKDLPNLGSFSQGKYNFMWPLLEDVEIRRCPNMKKFCLGSISIPKEVANFFVEEESVWQEFNDCTSSETDRSD